MDNIWRSPVFDRTIQDVELAIQKLSDWKKNHTHVADVRVENDALVMRDAGTAYVDDDKFVVENEGAVYVEDDVLTLDLDDVVDLKGCLNLGDLNRIENNIAFLADMMESYSYAPNIHGKQWTNVDLPNQNDMSRIITNIRALVDAFYSPDDPPPLPSTMLSYEDINAVEKNLYLIKQLLDVMQTSFKKAGTNKSGSTTFLPLRR